MSHGILENALNLKKEVDDTNRRRQLAMTLKYGNQDRERLRHYLLTPSESAGSVAKEKQEVQDMAQSRIDVNGLSLEVRKTLAKVGTLEQENRRIRTNHKTFEEGMLENFAKQRQICKELKADIDDLNEDKVSPEEVEEISDLLNDVSSDYGNRLDSLENIVDEHQICEMANNLANLEQRLDDCVPRYCDIEAVQEELNEVKETLDDLQSEYEDAIKELREGLESAHSAAIPPEMWPPMGQIKDSITDMEKLLKSLEGKLAEVTDGPDSPEGFRRALQSNGEAIRDIQQAIAPLRGFKWPHPDDQREAALAWCEELQLKQESNHNKLDKRITKIAKNSAERREILAALEARVDTLMEEVMNAKNAPTEYKCNSEEAEWNKLFSIFKEHGLKPKDVGDMILSSTAPQSGPQGSIIIGEGASVQAPVSTHPITMGATPSDIKNLVQMMLRETLDEDNDEDKDEAGAEGTEEEASQVMEIKTPTWIVVLRVLEFIIVVAGLVGLYFKG